MYCSVVEPDRAPGQCKIRILDTTKNPNTDLLLAKEYLALYQHSSVNTSKENMLYYRVARYGHASMAKNGSGSDQVTGSATLHYCKVKIDLLDFFIE